MKLKHTIWIGVSCLVVIGLAAFQSAGASLASQTSEIEKKNVDPPRTENNAQNQRPSSDRQYVSAQRLGSLERSVADLQATLENNEKIPDDSNLDSSLPIEPEPESESDDPRGEEALSFLEGQFSTEAPDPSWSVEESNRIASAYAGATTGDPTSIDCRWTMCRIEFRNRRVPFDEAFEAGQLNNGGFFRIQDDGTTIIFAGRAGFPFEELGTIQ